MSNLDHAPFIRAILASEKSDDAMGIYADWLEEQGNQPRAEYVRTIRDLNTYTISSAERKQITKQQEDLYARYHKEWQASLPKVSGLHWIASDDRLINEARIFADSAKKAKDILAVLFSVAPIRRLQFWNLDEFAARAFAQSPDMEFIDTIDCQSANITVNAMDALLKSKHFTRLRSIKCHISHFAGLQSLAPGALPALSSLDVKSSDGSLEEIQLLSEHHFLERVQDLSLRDSSFGPDAIEIFANSNHLSQLRSLDLAGNPIKTRGFFALAQSQGLSGLGYLNVSRCQIGNSSFPINFDNIAQVPSHSVHEVDRESRFLEAYDGWDSCPGLANLGMLDLSRNSSLQDFDLETLSLHPIMPKLIILDLEHTAVGRDPSFWVQHPHMGERVRIMLTLRTPDESIRDAILARFPKAHITIPRVTSSPSVTTFNNNDDDDDEDDDDDDE